jgi:hypothetical protein
MAGHDVETVASSDLGGQPDAVVLDFARTQGRVLLTGNCVDFRVLHEENSTHSGIVCIYREANPSKNMNFDDIVGALNHLDQSGFLLTGQFVALNAWR